MCARAFLFSFLIFLAHTTAWLSDQLNCLLFCFSSPFSTYGTFLSQKTLSIASRKTQNLRGKKSKRSDKRSSQERKVIKKNRNGKWKCQNCLPTKITIKQWPPKTKNPTAMKASKKTNNNLKIERKTNGKIVNWLFVVLLQQLKFPHQVRLDLFIRMEKLLLLLKNKNDENVLLRASWINLYSRK